MKKISFLRLPLYLIPGVAALALLAPATAEARERNVTAHGKRGGLYQRQVIQSPGQYSSSRSATLPDGRTAQRSFSTQRTDSGRLTTAQATGAQGRTATYDSSRNRTDNGYVRDVAISGPEGSAITKQVNVSQQDGTVTRTVTATTTHP